MVAAFLGDREGTATCLRLDLKQLDNKLYEKPGHRPQSDEQLLQLESRQHQLPARLLLPLAASSPTDESTHPAELESSSVHQSKRAHCVFHAINLDSDSIAQELMKCLFGISTRSDGEHNGLADTTSEY